MAAFLVWFIAGAVGANIAVSFFRRFDLGWLLNTFFGAGGGFIGGFVVMSGVADVTSLLVTILASSTLGGITVIALGYLRDLFGRR